MVGKPGRITALLALVFVSLLLADPAFSQTDASAAAGRCSFNGGWVANGSSVVAYQAPAVAFGSTCASQKRVCTKGTLSGTYAYASCAERRDRTPPTISVVPPPKGALFGSIIIKATATDNDSVASVQFYIDGQALGKADTAGGWAVRWNTLTVKDGRHNITAVAADPSGNTATSDAVPVIVKNTDTTAPTVSVTSPIANTTVGDSIIMGATAGDDHSVAGVQFFVDGAAVAPMDAVIPYAARWNTLTVDDGRHSVVAVARDTSGNYATSSAVSIIVRNTAVEKTLDLTASVVSGPAAGFPKYLYPFTLPAGAQMTGLSGTASISGNSPYLGEALIIAFSRPVGACPTKGEKYSDWDQIHAKYPGSRMLGIYILKLSGKGKSTVSTVFTLPDPIPAGPCVYAVLDGGEASIGGYLTMASDMTLHYEIPKKSAVVPPPVQLIPLGEEICFGLDRNCQLHTTTTGPARAFKKVVVITQPGTLVGMIDDISDAAFMSPPFVDPPAGVWTVDNNFYLYPNCKTPTGLSGPANYFASVPQNATLLLKATLVGTDQVAVHKSVSINFPGGIKVKTGDCLVHLLRLNQQGGVDAESQVRVVFLPDVGTVEADASLNPLDSASAPALDEDTPVDPSTAAPDEGVPSNTASIVIAFESVWLTILHLLGFQ